MTGDAQLALNEALAATIQKVAETTHESDKRILDVVNTLITRVLALEEQVGMLMELHRVGEDK